MKLEPLLLTLGGILVIVAFFFPFLIIPTEILSVNGNEVHTSGLTLCQEVLGHFEVIEKPAGEGIIPAIIDKWNNATDWKELGLVVGLLFIMGGPIWFGLHSIGYIWKGFRGKQYGRGIFFAILFLGFSWTIIWLWGNSMGLSLNFFQLVQPGFWMGCAGMILAAFSLFFEQK